MNIFSLLHCYDAFTGCWQCWKTYPDFTATLWSFSDRRENINDDDVVAIYSDL